MKTFKNLLICSLVYFLSITISSAQNRKVDLKENLPFDQVLAMAKKENKYIFLDFGSITCKPCLYIKQKVLTLDSVADFINERFVSVDYNVGAEKKRLSDIYKVVGEPVLLILNQNGELMHRMHGKMEGNEIMARFKQGLDPLRNSVQMDKRYAKGERTSAFILDYLETLYSAGEVNKMNAVSKEYLAGPLEKIKEPEIFPIFFKYVEDVASDQLLYMFTNRDEFGKLYGERKIEGKIQGLYSMASIKYLYGHSNPAEDPTYKTVLAYLQNSDHPKATEWLCYLVPAQYKFKDWPKMANEINNIYNFNLLKGKSGITFKDMIITQYLMYCNDPAGLKFAIQWCNDLIKISDEKGVEKYKKTIQSLEEKIKKGKPIEDTLEWHS